MFVGSGKGTSMSGACGSIRINTRKLTRSRDSVRVDRLISSFLIPRVVLRGRS